MIPFLLALSCLTKISKDCPQKTPIMSYQLKNIWSPTNIYESNNYQNGTWIYSAEEPNITSLKGVTLRVALIPEPPFVLKQFNYPNGTLEITGVSRTVLQILRDSLGFDWTIVFPKDGTLGIWNDTTKRWTGVVEMLANDEADLTVSFMSMIDERKEVLDFSRAFGEERWVIMMSRPQETTDGDGLVAPFQNDVWYYLLVSLVLMGPLCWILIKCRALLCKGHPTFSQYFTLPQCVWFVYGALMKQGSVTKPIADSTRILFATWWIFVTILTAFYTANLTAYLTLSKIPIPYDNLEKIGPRDYWIGREGDALEAVIKSRPTYSNASAKIYFRKEVPRYPEFNRMRQRIHQGYGIFLSDQQAIVEKVRREKWLFVDEQSRIERIIYGDFRSQTEKKVVLHKRCAFIMSRHPVFRVPYGFAFPKGSIYKKFFDPVLEKLAKGGIFHYLRRRDLPVKDPCSADSDFRERQLRNGDLMTTYILCGSGYILSLVSFLVEFIYRGIGNRKMQGQIVSDEKTALGFYKGNLTVPSGAPTFFDTDKFLKNINGRDYVVMKTQDGRTRLVPKNDGMQALQPVYNPTPPISYSFMS